MSDLVIISHVNAGN